MLSFIENITVTDSNMTSNLTDADEYAEWDIATAYVAEDIVSVSSEHKHYKAVVDTTGDDPTTDDGSIWVEQNFTNKYRAFDRAIHDQASNAETITYTFTPGEIVDSIAFFNAEATEIQVVVTSVAAGEVYNETFSMLDTSNVANDYDYFFAAIRFKSELVVSKFPPYEDCSVEVTINNPGSNAKVGQVDLGVERSVGTALYGTDVAFVSYSTKEVDTFGRYSIVPREHANSVKYRVAADPYRINEIRNLIAERKDTPTTFFVADTEDMGTSVFGYPNEFSAPLQFGATFFPLEIEGLT